MKFSAVMGLVTADICYSRCSLKSIIFFDCCSALCNREKTKRLFVVDTNGDWNLLSVEPASVFSDEITFRLEKMITNVQILTDEDQVIHAFVDADKRITTAYQNVRRIPNALIDNYGHWVEILDFSHNNLRDVEGLATAFRLHTLILDHNLISSDSYFPLMPQLRVLWLNNNLIFQLADFIPALSRACPNLVYLSLIGNPGASSMVMGGSEVEQIKYRLYVISYFDNLRHLDDKPVTSIERLRCEQRNGTMMNNLLSLYDDVKSVFRFNFGKNTSGVV